MADQPAEKQKALCVATRCTSVEQFVATFHRFCDETSFFVATLATRPVGLETAFSIQLEDKTPVLRGLCVVVEAWSTPANRFGRPGVRLDVRRLTNDSITVFKQLQQARTAAEASAPASAPQKAMHDPAAAQAAFDNAANAALDLIASEAAAAAKESKAALEAAGSKAMKEAQVAAPISPASIAAKPEPPPLMPKGTRDGMAPLNPKATQAIGALVKTPAIGTPTRSSVATPAIGTPTRSSVATPAIGTPTRPPPTPTLGKPLVANAFPAIPASEPADAPAVGAKPTKQMPPMPANRFAQPVPRLATPPGGSPTAPPPAPGAMKVTPPTAIPVVRAVPDVAKIESVKVRADGTAPVAKEAIAAQSNARAQSETTSVDSESFDEKTVDVQNKLSAGATPPGTKPAFDLAPVTSSTLETLPIPRVTLETGPIPKVTEPSKQPSFDIAPIMSSTLETGPIRRSTIESGPIATKAKPPEETRTPGSAFVLPANPLMNLTDASLGGFIDCALYEETGNFYRAEDEGLVDVGDLVQPPLPNQLSPIQALRPGDVSDRQPSYIGPMPNQHSYMGQMPTGNTQPPPMAGYMPAPNGYTTQPPPMNGLSPMAFNARRAASEVFAPEQTPIPMLLGPGYAQRLEDAARDHAATTPPPFGPPETRNNWARAETPDPSRNTPLSYARVEVHQHGPDSGAQFGRSDTVTQQVEMDLQRSTGQTPPLGRDYATGAFTPQRGGRYATGQFPPQPMNTPAPDVAPGTHPLVGPGAMANGAPMVDANGAPMIDANGAPMVDANGYPVAFAQPASYPQANSYPPAEYAQANGYPPANGYPQQFAQHAPNHAMHAASLPSTPLTPRPRRERTQMTSAVNPRRWMVIAGSAAVATAALIAIILLATSGDKKTATAPTTKLATSDTHKIDSNVAKPATKVDTKPAAKIETKPETKIASPKNDAGAAVKPPIVTPPKENAIATGNDATVARPETKVVPPKEEPKTDDEETASESDAPPVVGSGPCRMEIATTPAGSIVKVDDRAIGPSPVTVAGPCKKTKIDVNHARYAAATKWVSPTEGTPANVDVQLTRPTHSVTVTSSPAGATVSIAGRRAGTTPTNVSLMGFTTLTLSFEKKGYGTVTQKFYSKKDNDRVTVTLKKGK